MHTKYNYFIDPHMHAFDLSHPNLSAFLLRKDLIKSLVNKSLLFKALLYSFIVTSLYLITKKKTIELINNKVNDLIKKNPQIKNTLAFYENSLDYQFLLIDYYLKKADNQDDIIVEEDNTFKFDKNYNKILLCPLAVDFGYKNIDNYGVYYNKATKKPMGKQLSDLYNAIENYYKYNLVPNANNNELDFTEIDQNFEKYKVDDPKKYKDALEKSKAAKLFEIYPFMGLNTRHYTIKELAGTNEKQGLLDKYFSDFKGNETPEERQERLYNKIGEFDGNMYNKDLSVFKNIFTGIKVYPPLGYRPWPADDKDPITNQNERDKVKFLYEYCIKKRIPIITHCSDGGFEVDDFDSITDPGNEWTQVIQTYKDITLCFAHFGCQQNDTTWQKTITNLIVSNKNIYTDISCNDSCKKETDKDYYKELKLIIDRSPQLKEKVIFASDFSINMLVSEVKSYNQYLKKFIDADLQPYKQKLCNENAMRFLFGLIQE